MPEELDPTTARLVSELAAQILPALTKSLSSAIPSLDFSEMLDKNSRMSQELSLQVEKAIQSVVENSKTSQNIIGRSFENMSEEISRLKIILERRSPAVNEIPELQNILERASKALNELERNSPAEVRPSIEKAIQSGIDDSRASQSVIVQSIGNMLEEISSLKRSLERLPGNLEAVVKSQKSEENLLTSPANNDEISRELSGISEKLTELTNGIKYFFETYASHRENQTYEIRDTPILTNDAQLDRIINNALPSLEGLIKAESKSQHNELKEFSREISALHEQNNLAMINEVKEAVAQELTRHHENLASSNENKDEKKVLKLLKLSIMFSGAGMFLVIITILMLIMK